MTGKGRLAAALLATAMLAAAPAANAAMTGVEKWSTTVAYNELGTLENPWGSNCVSGKPYGSLCQAWCAHFQDWVLRSSGITHDAGGRPAFNKNVARAWSIYGDDGGGYGRYGTKNDAMPGDLLIDSYNGTAGTGGHISMVVQVESGRYVWTIGGNENNGVRLQRKDLNANSRYLVTLWEYRSPRSQMTNWNNQAVGTVYMKRFNSIYGPLVQISSLTDSGSVYSGSGLHNTYRIRAQRKDNGAWETFYGDQAISSIVYKKAEVYHYSGWGNFATLLYEDTYIDKSRAGSYTSTT